MGPPGTCAIVLGPDCNHGTFQRAGIRQTATHCPNLPASYFSTGCFLVTFKVPYIIESNLGLSGDHHTHASCEMFLSFIYNSTSKKCI